MGIAAIRASRAASLGAVTGAYVLAVGVAALWLTVGPGTGALWLDTLIADVLATLVIFGFSRGFGNSSFYDPYWSVVPPLLFLVWWLETPGADLLRCVLIALVVGLWSVRLTANWVLSFPGLRHEDWRYPMMRERAGRWEFVTDLFPIHLIPTVLVFAGMLPVYVAVTRTGPDLTWLTWLATLVGVAAVALELAADTQLRRFAAVRRPGEVLDRGLWAWSRHPNYFGEFAFWVSMALFGIAAAPDAVWWLALGAAGMLAMFLGASIPMMEQRSLERRPEYGAVMARVPKFVPWPPKRAA